MAAARGAGSEPEDRLQAMGEAYLGLIADRADVLCQLQAYAAAGDAGLREPVRDEFLRVFEAVREAAGVSREEASVLLRGRDLPRDRGRARDPAASTGPAGRTTRRTDSPIDCQQTTRSAAGWQ